ncbi:hypothetical protein [Streptomyces sp. Z26]|uniref:helix-turn-helix domain-containing protein n=1 Tax=Streptomyces sp. Z26 TaxID=2500177 RepID=UPI000EF153C0|nr:hypothetical protein [Streptomyces sp. Z26]RLL62461.1 hypothetical protein D7M15_28130 [Streptomyces sp. Z26]RLL68118.1 hypothetical protein D7M15_16155 [Streptomyces sp. Z26]
MTAAPLDVPRIPPTVRLMGEDRAHVRDKVVAAYLAGHTVAAIIRATGRSMHLVYKLLAEADVPLREPRQPHLAAPRAKPSTLRFPEPPPGRTDWVPLTVDCDSIRVGDLVLVDGQTHTVRDLRKASLDKLLRFDRGSYRLAFREELPARRRATEGRPR